jgi:nucleotide-binding universal stress UspA family protein
MGEAIVVGTDGSGTAARAVAEAARWAQALGAELHIVSAYEPMRGAGTAAEQRDGGVESTLTAAAAAVDVASTTHATRGKPAEALLEVASEVGASTIVVGSQGMHGVRRVLGSVPNAVSHGARCNVLIVATD